MIADLKGNVVLVTGGGRGIGRSIALAFARLGAKVAVTARTRQEIDETARLVRDLGATALAIQSDLTMEDQVREMVAQTEQALGPIDILIANAGAAMFKPFLETSVQDFDRLVAINARAVFLCCQAALPAMLRRQGGRIIIVASTAGRKGYAGQSAYCASKHAVMGLAKVLALETHGQGIRVHVICPGGVDTRLVREGRDDVDVSKYMRPDEIAEAAVFLATQSGIATIDELDIRRDEATPWA
jgi:NAD(P)-dependent dehydrogenase (short-subunit alcohol dehydrogenase family)